MDSDEEDASVDENKGTSELDPEASVELSDDSEVASLPENSGVVESESGLRLLQTSLLATELEEAARLLMPSVESDEPDETGVLDVLESEDNAETSLEDSEDAGVCNRMKIFD